MDRRNSSSGSEWDPIAGNAQVVRLGSHIYVSGTTGVDGRGQVMSPGDAYAQAAQALKNIEFALQQVGADRSNVVRTRVFVCDSKSVDAVARAQAEFFGKPQPPTSIVESTMLGPDAIVEIEAEAVLS